MKKLILPIVVVLFSQAFAFSQTPSGLPDSFNINGLAPYQHQSGGSSIPNGTYSYSETQRVTGGPFWWDTAVYTNSEGWAAKSQIASNYPGWTISQGNVNFHSPQPASGGYSAFYSGIPLTVLATNPTLLQLTLPGGAYIPPDYNLTTAQLTIGTQNGAGGNMITQATQLAIGLDFNDGRWTPAE